MLYGEKVFVRAIEEEDLTTMVKWRNDPVVGKYVLPGVPYPMALAKEKEWYANLLEDDAEKVFLICEKSTGKPIGSVGISNISRRNMSGFVSILIGETDYWGAGFGSEAMRLFLGYCFRMLNLRRVALEVYEYNERAIRCYEKLGFVKEGKVRRSVYKDGQYIDEYMMAIFQEEFFARYPVEPQVYD